MQGATVAVATAAVALRDKLGVMSGSVLYTHTDAAVSVLVSRGSRKQLGPQETGAAERGAESGRRITPIPFLEKYNNAFFMSFC